MHADAGGSMTFLMLGSLQNMLWVLWITHFSIKRTVGLQSQPWITALTYAVKLLLPTGFGRRSLWLMLSESFFHLLTFKWLFGYFSSLSSWQGESAWLWSVLPQQEGVYWPPLSSPARRSAWSYSCCSPEAVGKAAGKFQRKLGKGDAELLMPPGR